MALLETLESAPTGTATALEEVLAALKYNEQGLVPAVAQDHETREVLMLAWMDRSAIERTLADGFATYFSRSRQSYWRKGESSGHVQRLRAMHFDCDGDTVLLTVEQTGAACHTNRANCFYLHVQGDEVVVTQDRLTD